MSKSETNPNSENAKPYDREERTAVFAERSRAFVKRLPRTTGNIEDAKQFIRASGSIGANYIDANEVIGKKDFVMKIKICRREAKETCYWLRLLDDHGKLEDERQRLSSEARELMNIFGGDSPQMRVTQLEDFRFFLMFVSDFGIRYSDLRR